MDTSSKFIVTSSVVRGVSDGIYYAGPAASWNPWLSLSGATSTAPTLCSSGSGSGFELLVRGTDNGIYHRSYSTLSGWSSSWDSPGGATLDQPACAILGSVLYVVVRGSDNGIYFNSRPLPSGPWTVWAKLEGATSSPPVLLVSSNRLDLIVRGTDNRIYHKAWVGGFWSSRNSHSRFKRSTSLLQVYWVRCCTSWFEASTTEFTITH